ncbi:DMT family transporter [Yoonia sp. SS1-5]|uniref:DMT family transporter n=1 Tax=Yoonia rhodophyticola TaxID=3137370 RepID=A0AAN0MC45_9RHOB
MTADNHSIKATAIVVLAGIFWGFYWLPVRQLAGLGLDGAWGTLAITAAAVILLLPFAWRGRARLAAASPLAVCSVALGGVAFVLYSVGFLYGRVAVVVILFFLTPLWSTLLGRFVMGWPLTQSRVLALIFGIAGLAWMLGADGATPLPQGPGEWLGLASGALWAVATTGIRSRASLAPPDAAFVFAAGATVGALCFALGSGHRPDVTHIGQAVVMAVVAGGLWWALSMAGLLWAAARLEPARVGILLMAEVIVGAVSAAIIANEPIGQAELIGGALVLCAGICEVWPARATKPLG